MNRTKVVFAVLAIGAGFLGFLAMLLIVVGLAFYLASPSDPDIVPPVPTPSALVEEIDAALDADGVSTEQRLKLAGVQEALAQFLRKGYFQTTTELQSANKLSLEVVEWEKLPSEAAFDQKMVKVHSEYGLDKNVPIIDENRSTFSELFDIIGKGARQ